VKPWDEMTPRERDALVAEKVMGFTETDMDDWWTDDQDAACYWITGELVNGTWTPSQDMTCAWTVVAKMKADNRQCKINAYNANSSWWVIFAKHNGFGGAISELYEANSESAPEAICLAGLRAVGVEV
jgi:hypothetical protein